MSAVPHQHPTIAALAQAAREGAPVVADAITAIGAHNADLNAYLEVFKDAVEAPRPTVDTPIAGVPLAVKSNILVKGRRATAASRILEPYVAAYDATIIERLRAAGAVFVGATNMDEFAMGSSTEHSAYGPTRNPHDHTRVPGGSSGGSAAAVAAGTVPAALGTDTGGSIRQPASFCGIVGLKPTYGALSRSGLIAMGSSLDQAGPLARTAGDAALLFRLMRGVDPKDATTYPEGTYPEVPVRDHYRVGVPRAFLAEGVDADVLARFETSLETLAALGHEIVDVELPGLASGLAAYYIVMPAEVSSNLARFDGVRYGLHIEGTDLLGDYRATRGAGFGEEVRRRILLGTYVLSAGYYDAYYGTAERVRTRMREELSGAFDSVDVIATPTAPTPAWKIGEKSDPLAMYLADIFTVPANLTGVPAISVPMGVVEREGAALPVGIQFMGPWAGEERLLALAGRFLGED